jgi:DNA-binding response OmpR family regulator
VKSVLVIDDDPGIGSLVSFCLDHLEIDVLQAGGLDDALDLAHSEDIGLVLLDLALGEEDGLEILPTLREEPRLFHIPIVAFTAHDSRRNEALKSGVDSFLCRPFLSADLRMTVELHLVR